MISAKTVAQLLDIPWERRVGEGCSNTIPTPNGRGGCTNTIPIPKSQRRMHKYHPYSEWSGRMHKYHPYSVKLSKQHRTSCACGWGAGCLPAMLTGRRGLWLGISGCLGSFCAAMCLCIYFFGSGTQLTILSKSL